MLRRRWKILIGIVAIALLGGAFSYPRKPDPFAFLKPYVVSDITEYTGETVKGNGIYWSSRHIVVKRESTREFLASVSQRFPASDGWAMYLGGPFVKIRETSPDPGWVETISVRDNGSGLSTVEYARRLSSQEVWGIRLMHLGHDPFKPLDFKM